MEHAAISRPKPLMVAHVLLLLAERPRHGYELAESLRVSEFDGVTTSTVYRELARLEEDGLVRSFWQSSQARGPARHMYELTDLGRTHLAACVEDIRDLMEHLARFRHPLRDAGLPAPGALAAGAPRAVQALARSHPPVRGGTKRGVRAL